MQSILIIICLFVNLGLFAGIERVYVGELQEQWRQPSDHLPIAVTVDEGSFRYSITSWNVLNSAYLHWIYDNSQGLARSAITQDDIKIKENGLTLRESHVIEALLQMIRTPQIISLQECSEHFIQELSEQLPEHILIIRSSESSVKNQNIVLYDARFFRFASKMLHMNVFQSEPARPLMEVVLQRNGKRIRIYNAHLRCDPSMLQSVDLAKHVSREKKQGEIVIVLGDLNVDQEQMWEAFELQQENAFQGFTPYRTTVSPELEAKAIDHIFIDTGDNQLLLTPNTPDSVLKGLQGSVDLLSAFADPKLLRCDTIGFVLF